MTPGRELESGPLSPILKGRRGPVEGLCCAPYTHTSSLCYNPRIRCSGEQRPAFTVWEYLKI